MSQPIELKNNSDISSVKYEKSQMEELADLQLLEIPYAKQAIPQHQQNAAIVTTIDEELITRLADSFPTVDRGDLLFTCLIVYLARLADTSCFDFGYVDPEITQQIADLDVVLAAHIPCRIEFDLERDLATVLPQIRQQVEFAKQRQSSIETKTHYSVLNSVTSIESGFFSVVIERVASLSKSHATPMRGRNLTLVICELEQQLCWRYNPEVLTAIDVERMNAQFQTLLQSIATEPERPLAYQLLLPGAERQQLLWEWNEGGTSFESDKCLHQLFETRVEQAPDAVAVVFERQQLTYGELNAKANQLAHYLRTFGVTPEMPIGFCLERSLELMVAILGILKAGGAYVPLDPAYPSERLSYMLEDAKISLLLTKEELGSHLSNNEARVVYLDSDWEKIASCESTNPTVTTTAENLAYVIYTSGSTGKPKGVMIPHQAISCFAQVAIANYEITDSDRALQFASINFDMAVEEIFTRLLAGCTLILRTDATIANLKAFCQACRDYDLTILNLPTAYWHELASGLANGEVKLPDCLRLIIVGGEKIQPELVKSWQRYVAQSDCRNLQLVNGYGPTETTICSTTYCITQNTEIEGEVPIGRPLPHLQTYILDRHRQPVPIGVPGELYIGGSSLARGYLNRAELTADKFIPNPFTQTPGARLYQTGDLVRYLSDGNIEYIGRIDKQVKIRGFRIELGEIETALARHPQVKATAVIAREDRPGDKKLVAYFVPQQPESDLVGSSQLRSFLQQQLPSYMLPTAYVRLESLPITPGGKVDRRALPAPDFSREDLKQLATPNSDTERKLVEIWQSVLQVSPIGIEDNFFELGGHSLLAVSLLSQIEQTFNRSIPLATFLGVPTIEGLAAAIVESGSATSETSGSLLFPIRETGSKTPLFLVNAMGTGMLAYKLLAKYLDAERPIYGIKALGMDDSRLPHNRIEQMAGAYIEEMLKVQPAGTGAYCLAGVCTGGTVAYEMACQLKERGLSVEFLGLIDSTARPNLADDEAEAWSSKTSVSSFWSALFVRHVKHNLMLRGLNNLFAVLINPRLKLRDKLSFTWDTIAQLSQKAEHKLEKITYRNNSEYLPYEVRRSQVFEAGVEALRHYTPRTYQGSKVVLIRARDNPEHEGQNYQLGWNELVAKGLEIYEIPADQTTLLFEPHIRTLAAKLNSCLADPPSNRSG